MKLQKYFYSFVKVLFQVLIRQNDKPWFNSELRSNIRLRDRFRKKYFKTKREVDPILFKQQRNKVNNTKIFEQENCINNIEDI